METMKNSIWFKNVIFYRLTKPFELSAEQLEGALKEFVFTPCCSQDVSKYGWTSPFGRNSESLVHASGDCLLFQARKEEKLIPSQVINDELEERVERIQDAEQRKVNNKENLRAV